MEEEEKWEMMIPKKEFPLVEEKRQEISLKELKHLFQDGLINLQQTPLSIVQKFPFAKRTFRKTPQLHLTFEYEEFNWLISNDRDNQIFHLFRAGVECLKYVYGQQLTFSYSKYKDHSLGSMMHYFYDIGIQGENDQIFFKFNAVECIFASTYEEILSYSKLYSRKKRTSEESKIENIQKAMCLYQVPVIVALSLSNDLNETSCKILVLYHFDNDTKNFIGKDLYSNNEIKIPYVAIQLLALEAWVGYNSTDFTSRNQGL